MHSKWQIWDFFSSYRRDYLRSFEGVLAINTFEPTCLKLVKDFLLRDLSDRTVHYKMASDVTAEWIEEEFQTLSLFGNLDSFFIHEANELSSETIDLLGKLSLEGRFVVLSFENEQSGWKKALKEKKFTSIMIEAPRFREYGKLLDFACSYLRLPLSFESKNWILESLENDLGTFYNAAFLIKLNFPDSKEIGLLQVKELLTIEKLDRFYLASQFSRKKLIIFYEKLVELECDFDKMRSFFTFLQSHIVKMLDPSYLSRKSFLTQYDKEIQSTSRIWKNDELIHQLKLFNHWEILCKRKDGSLWAELKRELIRIQY
jgi:hypothetical protein